MNLLCKLDTIGENDAPMGNKQVGPSTGTILIIAIGLIIGSLSLILATIIRSRLKKIDKNEPVHLHRNRGSSGITVTDQPELTPEQQIEMGPIGKAPGQQCKASPKERLRLPSVEILSV